MKIEFVNSHFKKNGMIKDLIAQGLESAMIFDWAVAFGQHSAFKSIESQFKNFFNRGGKSRAIFDLSSGITDPELIEELVTYPGESFCKVFCGDPSTRGIFHPKFYIFKNENQVKVLLGSSNFSISAFYKNFESCVYFDGELSEPFFNEISDSFQNDFWDSHLIVSPEADTDILKIYSDLYSQRNKSKQNRKKTVDKLENLLIELGHNNLSQKKINIQIAYLMGLICASAYSLNMDDVKNRTIKLRFKSAVKNTNTADEGYICSKVDGVLLGNIRLPQRKTQSKTLHRIFHDLKSFLSWDDKGNEIILTDNSKKQTIFQIEINFSKKSKVWRSIQNYLAEFRFIHNKFAPLIPKEILEAKDFRIQQHFLRGYFDFRSRVSKADSYPGVNGKMRVAIQIGTNDMPFLEQMNKILCDLEIETQVSDGSHRGKDNMIRMIPNKDILKFWTAGYHKILINSFVEYNDSLNH